MKMRSIRLIRVIRNELNFSQEKFGKLFGISKGAVSAWETGKSNPSHNQMLILDEIGFDITCKDFLQIRKPFHNKYSCMQKADEMLKKREEC